MVAKRAREDPQLSVTKPLLEDKLEKLGTKFEQLQQKVADVAAQQGETPVSYTHLTLPTN